MATYYSQSSGVWSSLTRWDTVAGGGGSNPASVAAMEDNLFVIQDTHVIDFDIDTSAWTVGFQTITITGGEGTPGTLRCDSTTLAAGTYNVKMKTGFAIVGSAAAVTNHGRILANSDGAWGTTTPLANDRKFIISTLTGTSTVDTITATHLDIQLYCKQPAVTDYVEVYGVPFVVTFDNATEKFTIVSPTNTPAIPPDGTPITLSGTVPAELTAGTTYFVKAVSGATGELEASIAISDNGSGTIYMHYGCWGPVAQATEVNTTTGVITWNGVPPAANTAVRVKSSGTLPTGLTAYDLYYTITISGNTCKLTLISGDTTGIVIPSAVGSGNISMYCGSSYTNSKVVNVIQDVTTDWVATAGGNGATCVLFDYGPASYDQQRDIIATFNAKYLILTTNNADSAQYPLARIYLVARNVAVRSESTGTQPNISGATGDTYQCEITKTAAAGTTFYGYGLNSCNSNIVSGTISGCTYGLFGSNSNNISGTISGCSHGLYSGSNNTVSGTISGCSYGLNSSNNNTVSGTISGCTYGLFGSNSNNISGTISGCNTGLSSSNNNTVSGTISGCNTGLSGSNNTTVSGTIVNCTTTATLDGLNTLRNLALTPAVVSGRNTTAVKGRLRVENLGRSATAHKIYDNFGDIIKTACDNTGDAPSVDPDGGNGYCVEASNVQSLLGQIETGITGSGIYVANKLTIIEEQRIWLTAAAHTLTYKVQTTYAGISAGNLKLTCYYLGAGGATTLETDAPAINQRSDDTDWSQTLVAGFTSEQEGWATISIDLMEYESGNEVYIWPVPVVT
jgi:hypothetical protein